MTKSIPIKKHDILTYSSRSYLDCNVRYSPDDLIEIADKMLKDNILSIEIDTSYQNSTPDVIISRLETEKEMIARHKQEMSAYNESELTIRKINRNHKRRTKSGLIWCDKCDANKVSVGTKCNNCGYRNGPKVNKKDYKNDSS